MPGLAKDRYRWIAAAFAGGHRTGVLAVADRGGRYELEADIVKGGCRISGLFGLAPFHCA